MSTSNQCDYCMYLAYDEMLDEYYCTMSANVDQDDMARISSDKHAGCPFFRMGDDYTIVKKQGS